MMHGCATHRPSAAGDIRPPAICTLLLGFLVLLSFTSANAVGGDSGNGGLRLIALRVPDTAELGESASLECRFELGDKSNLYSVKWYKDDHEFFRYTPDDKPPHTQLFPVQGVNLDESESGVSHVTLRHLSFDSSGYYRCEVSTEAPDFKTVLRSKHMTVWAPPRNDPAVEGIKPSYAVGDEAVGNCTSASSYPAATLAWFLNGKLADRFSLDYYAPWTDDAGLQVTRLGIRFRVEAQHFRELSASPSSVTTRQVLELRCSATVQRMTRHRVVRSRLLVPLSVSTQKLAAQESAKGTASAIGFSGFWSSATCAYTMAFISLYLQGSFARPSTLKISESRS